MAERLNGVEPREDQVGEDEQHRRLEDHAKEKPPTVHND